jgi:hypothetical protein
VSTLFKTFRSLRPIPLALALLVSASAAAEVAPAASAAPAASSSRLLIDPDLSAETGAEDIITLFDLTCRLEDRVLKPRPFEEQGFVLRTGGIVYRLGKLLFLDGIPSHYADVFQHEYFGHGYRARELGYRDLRYHFELPPPFGDGSAYTSWRYPDTLPPSMDADIAIAAGGVEAEGILARRLRLSWLRSGTMDYHGALLYLSGVVSIRSYTGLTSDTTTDLSNDMAAYVTYLNFKEGYSTRSEFPLTVRHIDARSVMYLYDPFVWYSFWTILKTYAWSGDVAFNFPGIPVGWGWHYLPGTGYDLTPFGGEYLFDNLLWRGGRAVSLTLRLGESTFHRFWGFDAEADNLATFRGCALDAAFHLWEQPPLHLSPTYYNGLVPAAGSPRLGFGGSVDIRSAPLSDAFPLRLAAGLGYKGDGFVPGERLDAGFEWRAGVAFP